MSPKRAPIPRGITGPLDRIRLPRGPVTLAQLVANPEGSLVLLAHDPYRALELFQELATLAGRLAPALAGLPTVKKKPTKRHRGKPTR